MAGVLIRRNTADYEEALACYKEVVRLLRFFRIKRKPRVIDLGLVGVDPEFMNRGISAVFAAALMRMLREKGVEYAETNLNLEDNYDIQNLWKHFDRTENKRRRAFVKKLANG